MQVRTTLPDGRIVILTNCNRWRHLWRWIGDNDPSDNVPCDCGMYTWATRPKHEQWDTSNTNAQSADIQELMGAK